jgi:hypothetical protein
MQLVELGHFQLFPVFTGFEGHFGDGYAYGLRLDVATSAEKGSETRTPLTLCHVAPSRQWTSEGLRGLVQRPS